MDALAPYLFIIYQDYILRTLLDFMKENGVTVKKRQEVDDNTHRLRNYEPGYADDIALPANTTAQA